MRLQLISDLHLERCPDFVALAAPNVDVLVLAGDIGSYQAGSHLTDPDFGLARFSPLQPGAPWSRVLYVPGNHEYDGLDYEQTYARLRATCDRLGITWLEHEVLELGKVRFIGSTLWSDFDAFAGAEVNLTRQLQLRQKAYRAADYYLRKNTTLRGGAPMLAQEIRELSLAAQDWLGQALRQPFDGSTVVVTHFAPSLRSADARYGLSPGTAGFCNALDELLPYAQLWLHGHLHCANDYVVQGKTEGRDFACRVVANPLGYASKNEQGAFRPELVIELP
ncbi:MAG: metallophosphoesterase [Rhodoferax sp.]|uniref:metallophosphoesterase n=1 Tax=Rhodoferax sp. TaxID=50421 RepID=UPI00140157C4|nr:metallophosphoesterase [Rhodoferax sp.]NDP40645.1 metallophosphoesterase [Rhodoferax sp.]